MSVPGAGAPLTVLGIDPGARATGYGIISCPPEGPPSLVECGVVRTRPADPLPYRIREIFREVEALLDAFTPDAVAVEGLFYGKNVKSLLVLGHVRGAILLAAAIRDLEIHEYSPREIKKAVVGRGNATKDQVAFMVQEQLRLREPPRPSDAADGVACAVSHLVLGVQGALSGVLPHRFAGREGG